MNNNFHLGKLQFLNDVWIHTIRRWWWYWMMYSDGMMTSLTLNCLDLSRILYDYKLPRTFRLSWLPIDNQIPAREGKKITTETDCFKRIYDEWTRMNVIITYIIRMALTNQLRDDLPCVNQITCYMNFYGARASRAQCTFLAWILITFYATSYYCRHFELAGCVCLCSCEF